MIRVLLVTVRLRIAQAHSKLKKSKLWIQLQPVIHVHQSFQTLTSEMCQILPLTLTLSTELEAKVIIYYHIAQNFDGGNI